MSPRGTFSPMIKFLIIYNMWVLNTLKPLFLITLLAYNKYLKKKQVFFLKLCCAFKHIYNSNATQNHFKLSPWQQNYREHLKAMSCQCTKLSTVLYIKKYTALDTWETDFHLTKFSTKSKQILQENIYQSHFCCTAKHEIGHTTCAVLC